MQSEGIASVVAPVWVVYVFFPVGVTLLCAAFWPGGKDSPWYDPWRPEAFVWGLALIGIALDAAIFGYLPVWGD